MSGGSPGWTILGGLAVVGWLAGRYGSREAKVVFLEKLEPGESIRIVHEAGLGAGTR